MRAEDGATRFGLSTKLGFEVAADGHDGGRRLERPQPFEQGQLAVRMQGDLQHDHRVQGASSVLDPGRGRQLDIEAEPGGCRLDPGRKEQVVVNHA